MRWSRGTVVVHDFLKVGAGVACASGGVRLGGLLDAFEELPLLVPPQEALQVDHPLLQLFAPHHASLIIPSVQGLVQRRGKTKPLLLHGPHLVLRALLFWPPAPSLELFSRYFVYCHKLASSFVLCFCFFFLWRSFLRERRKKKCRAA